MRAPGPHNEKIVPAKKGYTLTIGETLIHSRYDPESEAEKYIASLSLKAFPFFILIEPGLEYLASALKKQFPSSIIITLHCSPFFDNAVPDSPSWNPACTETLEDFLERLLENASAADIKLIEWKPSTNAYGNTALQLASRTVECIRRISAGKKTARNFGRRWIRNALRNLERFGGGVDLERGSVPVLVCAAGPGLEDSFDKIAEWKQSPSPPFILSVSSAAPALLYRGIKPDIIVSTDGGSWALFHLIESCRYANSPAFPHNQKPLIAAALTAALPSALVTWPLVFLRDGSLWQEILAQAAGAVQGTNLVFPQRGTVSVTAMDLAFSVSGGNVYVSGLDFAHRDLRTHSRPYAFDWYTEQNAVRTQPRYSEIFKREAMIRASGSHGIYAAWFTTHVSDYPQRLFTLGSPIHGIPAGTPSVNKAGKPIGVTITRHKANLPEERQHIQKPLRKKLIDALLRSLDNPSCSQRLCKELGELLIDEVPADEKTCAGLLRKALLELV
jgi:hypothetical protein